jgi:hypothetical protein
VSEYRLGDTKKGSDRSGEHALHFLTFPHRFVALPECYDGGALPSRSGPRQRSTEPHRTVRRELALNTLGLLHEEQEQSIADESKIIWRYSLNEDKLDRETLLAMVHPAPF